MRRLDVNVPDSVHMRINKLPWGQKSAALRLLAESLAIECDKNIELVQASIATERLRVDLNLEGMLPSESSDEEEEDDS